MICFPFKPKRRVGGKVRVCPYYSGKLKLDTWLKPKVIALHTTDYRIAERKLQDMATEYEKEAMGLLPARSVRDAFKQPLLALLDSFLEDLKAKGRTPGTVRKYGGTLRVLFGRLGWIELRSVNPRTFVQWRAKANLGAKTVNDLLANMATFYAWLKANRLADQNPLEHIGRIDTRGTTQYRRALSVDEQARLLTSVPPWRALVYAFALYTGLRRKELNGLRWGDIVGLEIHLLDRSNSRKIYDCHAGVTEVKRGSGAKGAPVSQDTEVPGEVIADMSGRKPAGAVDARSAPAVVARATAPRQQPALVRVPAALSKNRKDATLPLPAFLADALRAVRPADAAEFQYVFRGRVPRIETFRKDLSAAGIVSVDASGRRIDFHALRATFGTTMLARGVHPVVVKELMRHSDLKLTTRLYTDASQLPLAAGVDALPQITLAPPGDLQKLGRPNEGKNVA